MKLAGIVITALLLTAATAPGTKPRATAPATKAPAAPATPPVAGDWNSYVRVSPMGTYIVGNPRAAVKVIEYLSYTCPHCATFSNESGSVFRDQMIKSGSLVVEYRPTIRDQIDLGATLLLRCIGPRRAPAAAEALFAKQDSWLGVAIRYLQNDANRYSLEPPMEQARIGAQLSGVADIMREQGMTSAEIDACFAKPEGLRQSLAVAQDASKIVRGTPTFIVNGVKAEAFEWHTLEPILRAKGAH